MPKKLAVLGASPRRHAIRKTPWGNAIETIREAMRARTRIQPAETETVELSLIRRARRFAGKGDQRKAMLALREACFRTGNDARLWALYGAQCMKAARSADGLHAFRQALYHRERARDERRAAVLRRILDRLDNEAA